LLRDGLFDLGGIGLPPSLNIQGGFRSCSCGFNRQAKSFVSQPASYL
jgi:hypothetical protein